MPAKTIALLGALDTKGVEYRFVKECIEKRGFRTLVINVGVIAEPAFSPDVSADAVAQAGSGDLALLREKQDRGDARL